MNLQAGLKYVLVAVGITAFIVMALADTKTVEVLYAGVWVACLGLWHMLDREI